MSDAAECFADNLGRSVVEALQKLSHQLDLGTENIQGNVTEPDPISSPSKAGISVESVSPTAVQLTVDSPVNSNSTPQNQQKNNDNQEQLSPENNSTSSPTNASHVQLTVDEIDDSEGSPSCLDAAVSPGREDDAGLYMLDDDSIDAEHIGLSDNSESQQGAYVEDWIDDDDKGYIVLPITEEEFFEIEQDALRKREIAARLNGGVTSWEAAYSRDSIGKAAAGDDTDEGQEQLSVDLQSVSDDEESENSDNRSDEEILEVQRQLGLLDDAREELAGKRDQDSQQDRPATVISNGAFGISVASSKSNKTAVDLKKHNQPSNATDASTRPSRRIFNQTAFDALRNSQIRGQEKYRGVDGMTHGYFNLKVIFDPFKTGFEEDKEFNLPKGSIVAGRYEVMDVLGQAAFSTALQCVDLDAREDEDQWVCLKVIKNNKDFFDQSLDEIKLLQYINSFGNPDDNHVVRMIDYFYYREHLIIVSELLKENLYEFGKYVRDSQLEPYFTVPRLKKISKQVLEALEYIHNLNLIHCDLKPENIVIKSYSRCEVKLIDFGSSCFTTDHMSTYIQSRSYRAPEVILGYPYDGRIDVWSLGAVVAEMFTGYVLFQNDSVATMLARITGILGAFPPHVLEKGRDAQKYFTAAGTVYEVDKETQEYSLVFPKETYLASRLHLPEYGELLDAYIARRNNGDTDTSDIPDDVLFMDFVRQTLLLDPELRPTAGEALTHPWLQGADEIDFTKVESIYAAPVPPPQEDEDEDTYDGEIPRGPQYGVGDEDEDEVDGVEDEEDEDESLDDLELEQKYRQMFEYEQYLKAQLAAHDQEGEDDDVGGSEGDDDGDDDEEDDEEGEDDENNDVAETSEIVNSRNDEPDEA